MKKRLLILAMFILLILAAIPSAMAACSHTCTWRITKSATCTTAGSKSYQCTKCNTVTKTATISAKGHNPTNATCTTAGKCTRCSAVINPATGHSWGSWTTTVSPTCVSAGKKVRKCSKCSGTDTQAIGKSAHTYIWVTTSNATCSKAGEKKYVCSYCEAVNKTESIPKIAHTMGSWTTKVSPTCVNAGRKERKCTKCSYTESQSINVTAHTYKWVTTSNATCTKAGEKKYICSYCDAVNKTESIAKLGHSMGSWTTTTAATCTSNGQKARSCTRSGCTYKETETITKLGHSMGSWTTTHESNCVNAGQQERKCSRCSYKETQSLALKPHTYRWVTVSSPTCTKTGEKRYMCSYCDHWEQSESIAKLGHSMGSWSVTAATCTKDGQRVRSCTRSGCSYKETETITKLGHSMSSWTTTTAATCTGNGQKVRSCTRSGCTYKETETITKLGHSMGSWTTTHESNCVNAGQQERKCSRCSYKETQSLALKPHTYLWVTVSSPTCTKAGEKRYMCSYCDHWEQSESIAKLGHNLGSWTTTHESNCVIHGQQERKCTKCSYKETQSLALKPHTYLWVTVSSPTCTQPGEKRYMCSYCDYWEQSESIPKVAHAMGSWTTTHESNCVNHGQQERKCTKCSYKETQSLALKPHTYLWVTVSSPTCTQLGEKRYMCSYCDYWEQSETIPKVAHTMGSWTTTHESNCVYAGQKERKCTKCSYKETQSLALKPHTYLWVTVSSPTCKQLGEKRYMCSYCDYWEESESIPKVEHSMGAWKTTYEPNCVNPGQKERKCIWCTYKETQGIGVTNHDYQWVTVSNPSCTQPGEKRYMCTYCDNWDQSKESQVIPKLDHVFKWDGLSDYGYCMYCGLKYCEHFFLEETEAPTCVSGGRKYERCTYCQKKINIEPLSALGHDWGSLYYSNGKWYKDCERAGCNQKKVYVRDMTDYEFALFQDDIEGELMQPWVQRWLEDCADPDKDVPYDDFNLSRADAALTSSAYLDEWEDNRRYNEFKDVIGNYVDNPTEGQVVFLEFGVRYMNGEGSIEGLLPILEIDNQYPDADDKKQALIDSGCREEDAEFIVMMLDIADTGRDVMKDQTYFENPDSTISIGDTFEFDYYNDLGDLGMDLPPTLP